MAMSNTKYDYNMYIDVESGEPIDDPWACMALTKLDQLYDEYLNMAKKSSDIMVKYNIR